MAKEAKKQMKRKEEKWSYGNKCTEKESRRMAKEGKKQMKRKKKNCSLSIRSFSSVCFRSLQTDSIKRKTRVCSKTWNSYNFLLL